MAKPKRVVVRKKHIEEARDQLTQQERKENQRPVLDLNEKRVVLNRVMSKGKRCQVCNRSVAAGSLANVILSKTIDGYICLKCQPMKKEEKDGQH